MDLLNTNDASLDTLRYPVVCPNCGMPDCICGTHTRSPFSAVFNDCSPETLLWTEHTFSLDEYQPICQNTTMPTPSLNANHTPSAFLESHTPESLSEKSVQRSDCACLRGVLLISEQLERYAASKLGFKNLVMLSRKVIDACEQYPKCQKCEEFLITTLCVTAMRRISAYYREIASAPQEAFALDERTFSCRIGNFGTVAVLDEDTCKLVLCADIRRSLRSMTEYERLLGPDSKEAQQMDGVTRHYYQEVMKTIKDNLQDALDLLRIKDG